ncbi:hypothetical protein T440DRAFT_512723 [Plenodomus tracheiphilus IPT5]|uniref:N(6)-L-threonylcarbamoyladenine synthase n=1 Tax=Plenodomus tracheiphilus IPT5 TaxID=1408161 RepID=A0A6A7BMP1_9PLEO|nr:hypothetical protein T440DRAFT_512723 [Plenodomus tracheiphilus IPT5]
MTLAIETSCDDTSVAIVEKHTAGDRAVAQLHFHKKVTSNNAEYQGVHPLISLQSHQQNLANLVAEAIANLPLQHGGGAPAATAITLRRLPDFISVTRGPGMRSNLFTGLDTAKGLAVAWQRPLVGVHHMQAHALTPRLVSALNSYRQLESFDEAPPSTCTASCTPSFPFLSVLASGGHTLLIHSASLVDHHIMGSTQDIAVGECLDKIARVALPSELLQTTRSTMYGALLEAFAFPPDQATPKDVHDHNDGGLSKPLLAPIIYTARSYLDKHSDKYNWSFLNHEEATQKNATQWGWAINQPLIKSGGGNKIKSLEMSFSGLMTAVERIVRFGMDPATRKLNKTERAAVDIALQERRDIARDTMRAAFEHVASRVVLGLQSLRDYSGNNPAVVMAGGVAANSFLRHILASTLCANGFSNVELHFPPPYLCTDNAAMIGWAGIEMFEAGHTSPLSIRAIRKWPLDQLLDPTEAG